MNAGPPEEVQGEVPPPPSPPSEAPPPPAPEAQAPSAYAPPPAPMAPPARRGMGPLIAVGLVVILVIVAVVAYAGIGYAYAQGRVNSATDTYNSVIADTNSYTDSVNALTSLNTNSLSTSSDIAAAQAKITDLVNKAQKIQGQVDTDQAKLRDADSSLKQNSWLTVFSKSNLDRWSTKIGHLEKALDAAKVLAADDVQIGAFYATTVDVVQDLDTFTSKFQNQDIAGAQAAIAKLKTDAAKGVSEDKAPGLPAEADTFMKDMQKVADDFGAMITAAAAGDETAFNAASNKLDNDVKALEAIDYNKIDTAVNDYRKPYLDTYNNEIKAANNT